MSDRPSPLRPPSPGLRAHGNPPEDLPPPRLEGKRPLQRPRARPAGQETPVRWRVVGPGPGTLSRHPDGSEAPAAAVLPPARDDDKAGSGARGATPSAVTVHPARQSLSQSSSRPSSLPSSLPANHPAPDPAADARLLPRLAPHMYPLRFQLPEDARAVPGDWVRYQVHLPLRPDGTLDQAKGLRTMDALQKRASLLPMDEASWAALGRLFEDAYRAMPLRQRARTFAQRSRHPAWTLTTATASLGHPQVRVHVEEWSAACRLMPQKHLLKELRRLDRLPVLPRLKPDEYKRYRLQWQARFGALFQAAPPSLRVQLESDVVCELARLAAQGAGASALRRIVVGDRLAAITELRFNDLLWASDTSTSSEDESAEAPAGCKG